MSGRGLGLNFTIGARLSSSIASAFQTLDARMRRTSQAMRGMRDTSRQLTSALDLRARRDDLRQQYIASGRTDARLLRELRDVSSAYREARTRALRYGNTVEQWRAHQARVNAELNRTAASMRRLNALQAERANRREIVGGLMAAVAPAASVAMPVKLAIDFESGMADAAKTMDGMRDAVGNLTPRYYEMQNVIKGMGRELPLAHDELARLFAAGGQLGMSDVGELQQFATMSAHMAVAFGMSSEEAAESIGKFRTSLKMSLTDVGSVLDLMNQYANTSSAKEKDIAETLRRIGSLGNMAGVSAKPMAALAASLTAVGVAPDVAATGLQNMLLAMTKGTAATKDQQAAFARLDIDLVKLSKGMQRDGPAAILEVLRAIKKLEKHEQLSIVNRIFGTESIKAITPFVDNLDLTIRNMETAGDTSAYAGAMAKEFANRADTTANALLITKNRAAELGINIGTTLLPPIRTALDTVNPLISALADWTAANPAVVTGVMGAAGGLVALKLGMLAARLAVSGLRSAMLTATAPLHLMRAAFGGVGIAGRLAGEAARRAARVFSVSWSSAIAPVTQRLSQLRGGMSSLRASVSATVARLRSLGIAGTLAGTRALVAGGMARASAAGWRVLSMGVRGVGAAFRVAFGPMSLLLTGLSLGVDYLIANWDRVTPYFAALWERIKAIFKAGLAWVQPVIDTIGKGFSLVRDTWDWVSGNDAKESSEDSEAPRDGETAREAARPRKSLLERAYEGISGKAARAYEAIFENGKKAATVEPLGPRMAQRTAAPETSGAAAPPEQAAPETPQARLARNGKNMAVPTLEEREEERRKAEAKAASDPEQAAKRPRTPEEKVAEVTREAARLEARRAASEPEARPHTRPAASQAGGQAGPSASQAASQTGGQPAAPQVSVAMQFTLQGMPDATFADNVMRALKGRSGDVEALISSIVHNQARLAYGG